MANTEGIPDEDLHDLVTPSLPSFTNKDNKKSNRLSRLEKLMELPEGMTPSAKCIRRTPASVNGEKVKAKVLNDSVKKKKKVTIVPTPIITPFSNASDHTTENGNEAEYDAQKADPYNRELEEGESLDVTPPAVVSECIRERPLTWLPPLSSSGIQEKKEQTAASVSKPTSRFKQQLLANNNSRKIPTVPKSSKHHPLESIQQPSLSFSSGGFPSLDLPIGTFTRKTRKTVEKEIPSHEYHNNTQNEQDNKGSFSHVRETTRFNPAEIKQGLEEIESVLSPETIAFLKKRGREKMLAMKKGKNSLQRIEQTPRQEKNKDLIHDNEVHTMTKNERQEKIEMAEILSSIKTMQDLDNAYEDYQKKEIQDNGPLKSFTNKNNIEESSDSIEVATSLLRSSSSHQRLLGAKTISTILSSEVNIFLNHMDDTNSKGYVKENRRNYPLTLPVSLRCLLDLPSPQKHIMLHCHILQSLFYLVLLHSHPYHIEYCKDFIDYLNQKQNEPYNNGKRKKRLCPSFIFQEMFLQDNVPTLSPELCYPKTDSVTYEEEQEQKSSSNSHNYIINTGSSSSGASKDGTAFYEDPSWTLLSKMKIIPCVNRLVKAYSQFFPVRKMQGVIADEIWISICGILLFTSLRSPGAALAIGQHESLLSNICQETLAFNFQHQDDNEAKTGSSFIVNTKRALPILILLCTVSRQSSKSFHLSTSSMISESKRMNRNIFMKLFLTEEQIQNDGEDISTLLAILSYPVSKENNHENERLVKYYSLVLIRILTRYCGFTNFCFSYSNNGDKIDNSCVASCSWLSTFLSLSLSTFGHVYTDRSSVTFPLSSSSFVPEFLTCFGNFCEGAKTIMYQQQEQQTSNENKMSNILSMTGGWFGSHARSSATFLINIASTTMATTTPYHRSNFQEQVTSMMSANEIHKVKTIASSFAFLSSFLDSVSVSFSQSTKNIKDGSTTRMYSILPLISCVQAIKSFLPRDFNSTSNDSMNYGTYILSFALSVVLSPLDEKLMDTSENERYLQLEAVCASFIRGLISFLWNVAYFSQHTESDNNADNSSEEISTCFVKIGNIILNVLKNSLNKKYYENDSSNNCEYDHGSHIARKAWLNSAHSFVAKTLAYYTKIHADHCLGDEDLTKMITQFTCLVLGKLQSGEEALAAMILSEDLSFDKYFIESKLGIGIPTNNIFPPSIQRVLLKEICGIYSKNSRNQYLHSIKLHRIPLISLGQLLYLFDNGNKRVGHQYQFLLYGPSGLESLRSQSDPAYDSKSAEKSNESEKNNSYLKPNPILPLGHFWLWNILSSTIQSTSIPTQPLVGENKLDRNVVYRDAIDIVSSCLEFLQRQFDLGGESSSDKENGIKLYHLLNICLLPEEVLQNERVEKGFLNIFKHLTKQPQTQQCITSFIKTCYEHSSMSPSSEKNLRRNTEDDVLHEQILYGTSGTSPSSSFLISGKERKSLDDFMDDMCTTFIEYGGTYKPMISCIKFLLSPEFPSEFRQSTLMKLAPVLHLLNDDIGDTIKQSLLFNTLKNPYIYDGKKGYTRDEPGLLDSLSVILKTRRQQNLDDDEVYAENETEIFNQYNYIDMVAIAYLGRNIALLIVEEGGEEQTIQNYKKRKGQNAMTKRLQGFDCNTLKIIFNIARGLLLKRSLSTPKHKDCNNMADSFSHTFSNDFLVDLVCYYCFSCKSKKIETVLGLSEKTFISCQFTTEKDWNNAFFLLDSC